MPRRHFTCSPPLPRHERDEGTRRRHENACLVRKCACAHLMVAAYSCVSACRRHQRSTSASSPANKSIISNSHPLAAHPRYRAVRLHQQLATSPPLSIFSRSPQLFILSRRSTILQLYTAKYVLPISTSNHPRRSCQAVSAAGAMSQMAVTDLEGTRSRESARAMPPSAADHLAHGGGNARLRPIPVKREQHPR